MGKGRGRGCRYNRRRKLPRLTGDSRIRRQGRLRNIKNSIGSRHAAGFAAAASNGEASMSLSNTTVTSLETLSQAYLETLLSGDRSHCRSVLDDALSTGAAAYDLLTKLVWPTM